MPPRRIAPVAFTQEALFEAPIEVASRSADSSIGAAPVALTGVEAVLVERPVQSTIDDALREQEQPQRAVLGGRAIKWVPLAERGQETEQTEISIPRPTARERGLAERDALAVRAMQREQARQAAGRAHRLAQQNTASRRGR